MEAAGDQRPRVVPDVLRAQARAFGSAPAIVVDHGTGPRIDASDLHTLSFEEWDRRSDSLAAALIRRGLARGDRVALAFENGDAHRFYVGYFAVAKAGGVAVPIGIRLSLSELGHVLRHAEPRLALAGASQTRWIESLGIPDLAIIGPEEADRLMAERVAPPSVDLTPEDPCDILYTSGTTGTPKGVCSTHANLVTIRASAMKAFAGRAFVHAVPVHTFAGTHAMQFLPLRAGMKIVVMREFDGARYLSLLAASEAAVSYAVPAMLRLAIDAWDRLPAAERPDPSGLFTLLFGASAMPPALLQRLPEVFPNTMLVNLYASTESGSASCAMPPGEAQNHPGSVGKPVPPTEVRIVAPGSSGSAAAPGETGEIWIRGSGGSRKYFKDPEATTRTFVEGGWVRTGDLGHLDGDGYLYLDGRQQDVVNRGGLKIFVEEIDAVLAAHPAIQEAAVVGVPHPVLGEDVAAFVVLRTASTARADDLRSWLAERVAEYKVPRRWAFIDALPRNTMGKVVRRELSAHTSLLETGGGAT